VKVGDVVQHREKFISKGGVQKRGIVIEIASRSLFSGPEMCVLGLWGYPGVGLRWLPVQWLEVISESR
jgi:hypothetical protein